MMLTPCLGNTDAEILVPLTTSLYVPGKLADREKVIVDIGTGFYVEKVHVSPSSLSPQISFLKAHWIYGLRDWY
jgi:prefoldin alpha subunit